jgi:formylglycine-generating enzyme required for sulfatase activity
MTWSVSVLMIFLTSLSPGCQENGSNSGDDTVSGDADADIDTDADADTDTMDWGELIPCENQPGPGEVCIPGGKYLMGCVPGDVDCEDNEKPLVAVTLSPFFMDQYEATYSEVIDFLNTLFDGYVRLGAVLQLGATLKRIWLNYEAPIFKNYTDDLYHWYQDPPSENFCELREPDETSAGGLSWLGAKLYCEHKGKSLPTEAQWEAAARGRTYREFPCGSSVPACAHGPYDCCSPDDECPEPGCLSPCCIPFGPDTSCPSPYGVHTMLGNAEEWVLDWASDSDDHSFCAAGCTDPQPRQGQMPVLKGGGVASYPGYVMTRISARYIPDDENGRSDTGVRCVRPDEPLNKSAARVERKKQSHE